jgi:hypothetical protein
LPVDGAHHARCVCNLEVFAPAAFVLICHSELFIAISWPCAASFAAHPHCSFVH